MADASSLGRRFFVALVAGDEATLRDVSVPDVEFLVPGLDGKSVDDALAYSGTFLIAFPDASVEFRNEITSGDTVAFEIAYTGTHTGTLASPMGEVPATGKSISIPSSGWVRIAGDRAVSFRGYFDTGTLMAQLGVTPSQG
jgi:predicted ester cyclase